MRLRLSVVVMMSGVTALAVSLLVYGLLISRGDNGGRQDAYNLSSVPSAEELQEVIVSTVAERMPSVVNIIATREISLYQGRNPRWRFFNMPVDESEIRRERRQVGGGSAIFVHQDGYLLTNRHVVENLTAEYTAIFSDGTIVDIEEIWLDSMLDIALIQLAEHDVWRNIEPARAVSLHDTVHVGQFVLAIGNALAEFQNSVTLGIISGRNRQLGVINNNLYAGLYQTDASINMGNSWGPLLDIYGRVIGLNTAISAQGESIGFAIPVTQEFIDATVASVIEEDKIWRPYIGVQYIDLNPAEAQRLWLARSFGIYVQEVMPDTPAYRAGIQPGDIITAIEEKQIHHEAPFLYQLFTFQPQDTITLTIERDGLPREIDITLWRHE